MPLKDIISGIHFLMMIVQSNGSILGGWKWHSRNDDLEDGAIRSFFEIRYLRILNSKSTFFINMLLLFIQFILGNHKIYKKSKRKNKRTWWTINIFSLWTEKQIWRMVRMGRMFKTLWRWYQEWLTLELGLIWVFLLWVLVSVETRK